MNFTSALQVRSSLIAKSSYSLTLLSSLFRPTSSHIPYSSDSLGVDPSELSVINKSIMENISSKNIVKNGSIEIDILICEFQRLEVKYWEHVLGGEGSS